MEGMAEPGTLLQHLLYSWWKAFVLEGCQSLGHTDDWDYSVVFPNTLVGVVPLLIIRAIFSI
jgi:hypothetical protein